ncbi:hypothetical protein FA13DRAFT_343031, partial [Coprinellus micaceus]
MPGEDTQRLITDPDEGIDGDEDEDEQDSEGFCMEEMEAVGDGLGMDEDSADWRDDLDDPEPGDPSPDTNEMPQKKPSPMPFWLETRFKWCLEKAKDRRDGTPRLYWQNHTFWFPQESTWFLLQSHNPTPQLLYNPKFFLWDPMSLKPIACPHCGTSLVRHGHIARPRRVVDLDSTYWVVGYRYRCPSCRHHKSGRHTVTFQSWDKRVLDMIGWPLAAMFSAKFTKRSGVSIPVFELMRMCFLNGMGAKQFSDTIRTLHLLNYDKLYLQYLSSQASIPFWARSEDFKVYTFPPYDDSGPMGPHGYVPSATYFRKLYDEFIEEHRDEIMHHTSMLSLESGALDHSFKFPKHVRHFNGEPPFAGLLSVNNQNGEIRSCHLVTTTGHSQSLLALTPMLESLQLFGHQLPRVFYTDNVLGDKQLLESVFPSLLKGVIAIEKYQHLEAVTIPPQTSIILRRGVSEINAACREILDELSEDGTGHLVIGFDVEWNVWFTAGGRIQHSGPVGLVQLAYGDRVYLFQVGDMVADGTLPAQLKALLRTPQIWKVGRKIDPDLKALETACHSATGSFSGAVDLAKLAKQRGVLQNIADTSLSDLCARVLHKRLNKNVGERVSN